MSRRRLFNCGHKGRGRYCHRCHNAEALRDAKQTKRLEWQDALKSAPFTLDGFPCRVARKILKLLDRIQRGEAYVMMQGKRLIAAGRRDIISIPIGYDYRLICQDVEGSIIPLEALSHEQYSSKLKAGGWEC